MPSFTATTSGTTAAVWYSWVSDDLTNTTATASSGDIWRSWVTVDTSATTSTNATVWVAWTGTGNVVVRQQVYQPPSPPTAEEIAARHARAEQEAKEKAEADTRANELLESHLTEEQRRQLRELDAFIVDLTSKQYRIRRGWAGNVDEIKDGMVVARHCIHPAVNVPYGDHMLSQKFMLETNEAEFLRIANRTPLTPTPLAV
jgi:hypothetical protein